MWAAHVKRDLHVETRRVRKSAALSLEPGVSRAKLKAKTHGKTDYQVQSTGVAVASQHRDSHGSDAS